MNMSGKVGAVKMQPLYALKRLAEEYSMSTVIGGGILKRFETIINEKVKEVKTQELVTILEDYKKTLANNKKASKDFLIKAGIITQKGTLRANYKHLCIPQE